MPRLARLTPVALLLSLLFTRGVDAQQVLNFGPGQSSGSNVVLPQGATVNVNGGTIGLGVDLSGGVLNINSGSVALGATGISTGFTNIANTVNLRGGQVGEFFQLTQGSEFNLSGGRIGSFGVFQGSTATITGGRVDRFPDVFNTGRADIFGGDLFSIRAVEAGAEVNLFGSEFALGGTPIDLAIGESLTIDQRGVQLTATLADGSPLEYDLNLQGSFFGPNPDQAAAGAIITVTRTPIQGDFNADGVVNTADYAVWRDALGSTVLTPFAGADADGDQQITPADYLVLLDNFGAGSPIAPTLVSIPEPATLGLLVIGFASAAGGSRRIDPIGVF